MKLWVTEIRATIPGTNEIRTWHGPTLIAESAEEAQLFCENNELGYCNVVGELVYPINKDINQLLYHTSIN